MKFIASIFMFGFLISGSNTFGQQQKIDPTITELFSEIKSSYEFVENMNYYFSITLTEKIDKKEVDSYMKIIQRVKKNDIPIYEIRQKPELIELYFKKGGDVYLFSLERKDDLYFSSAKCYTFKNRKIKDQGLISLKG